MLQTPFYDDFMNYACVGFWTGMVFTCAMLVGLLYTGDTITDPEQKVKHAESMTMVRRGACCSALLCSAEYCSVESCQSSQNLLHNEITLHCRQAILPVSMPLVLPGMSCSTFIALHCILARLTHLTDVPYSSLMHQWFN